MRLVFALALLASVRCSTAGACSYVTAEKVVHGYTESALPAVTPAPDIRFESFGRTKGRPGTNCDYPQAFLTLSVSQHHLSRASITFETLPSSTIPSPIYPGTYTTDWLKDGRLHLVFSAPDMAPGLLALKVYTVSPNGRRSKDTMLLVRIPANEL